jgi:hypothetical protein
MDRRPVTEQASGNSHFPAVKSRQWKTRSGVGTVRRWTAAPPFTIGLDNPTCTIGDEGKAVGCVPADGFAV